MKSSQYTPVRFSHLTSYAGIGSIIRDTDDKLMTLVDTRFWTDKNNISTAIDLKRISDKIRVCCAGGKKLKKPPLGEENDKKGIIGHALPAVLFPKYTVCQKCGLLHYNPWSKLDKTMQEAPTCSNERCNNKELKQVTWCAVSKQGYLDDVPWHYVCHLNFKGKCEERNGENYLRLTTDQAGRAIVECTKCLSQHRLSRFKCGVINRPQPWQKFSDSSDYAAVEGHDVEVLEINNPGVYFPQTSHALIIPPESRQLAVTIYDHLAGNTALLQKLNSIRSAALKKSKINQLATEYGCSPKEMTLALEKLEDDQNREEEPCLDIDCSEQLLLREEYKAFLTPIDDLKEDEDFVTKHKSDEWTKYISDLPEDSDLSPLCKLIDKLVMVKRLREIRIFNGFRRITPDPNKSQLVHPWVTGEQNWLPAIELFGEGVFFTLNEKYLSSWQENSAICRRVNHIEEQYKNSSVHIPSLPPLTPRFLLLHILSHLLIRELEASAGYPAASLNERIYSSVLDNMAGILIYTAVPDISGSMGGIIECAKPKKFLSLLYNCFKQAAWCSLDPVCSEHEGQGPSMLNRASCHACSLIPETACSFGNAFLDRNIIKGNRDGTPNLLDYIRKSA
jgi:hypothetical protein